MRPAVYGSELHRGHREGHAAGNPELERKERTGYCSSPARAIAALGCLGADPDDRVAHEATRWVGLEGLWPHEIEAERAERKRDR